MNRWGVLLTVSLVLGLGLAMSIPTLILTPKSEAQEEASSPPLFQVVQTDSVWDKDGNRFQVTTFKHQTIPDYCLTFIWTTDVYKSAGGPIEIPCP